MLKLNTTKILRATEVHNKSRVVIIFNANRQQVFYAMERATGKDKYKEKRTGLAHTGKWKHPKESSCNAGALQGFHPLGQLLTCCKRCSIDSSSGAGWEERGRGEQTCNRILEALSAKAESENTKNFFSTGNSPSPPWSGSIIIRCFFQGEK